MEIAMYLLTKVQHMHTVCKIIVRAYEEILLRLTVEIKVRSISKSSGLDS